VAIGSSPGSSSFTMSRSVGVPFHRDTRSCRGRTCQSPRAPPHENRARGGRPHGRTPRWTKQPDRSSHRKLPTDGRRERHHPKVSAAIVANVQSAPTWSARSHTRAPRRPRRTGHGVVHPVPNSVVVPGRKTGHRAYSTEDVPFRPKPRMTGSRALRRGPHARPHGPEGCGGLRRQHDRKATKTVAQRPHRASPERPGEDNAEHQPDLADAHASAGQHEWEEREAAVARGGIEHPTALRSPKLRGSPGRWPH